MAAIVAKNLTKVYDQKHVAVDNISFEVNEGEVFGFLGPNGAGKSSTISMITGISKPTSGHLNVLNKKMPNDRHSIKKSIGYVPQDLVFYNHLTVKENLDLFASAYDIQNSKEEIKHVLELLEMEEFKDQVSSTLSGGQKRRLNVGIGLLNRPELLILDEPSAGMDPQSRNVLWESIKNLAKENITIILTTHLMETADVLSDRICIIDHGKIQAIDTPSNLKKMNGDGDIIELKFENNLTNSDYEKISKIVKEIESSSQIQKLNEQLITLSISNGIDMLSHAINPIKTKLRGSNTLENINLRDNTLEDVFIQLTGSKLRE